MTHYQGEYGALDNRCPHQGGPLGEGSIENGYLRCPWHGWDYSPLTGKPPGDLAVDDALETFPVEIRKDGIYVGFGQYLAEFTTAVKYKMNITHILLNNCELGKISKEQKAGEWDVWQTSLHNPNFAKYAEICGGFGIRVTQKAELDRAIQQALAYKGAALVEVMSDSALI